MANQPSPLVVSNQMEIPSLTQERGIGISNTDWDNLIQKIEKIGDSSNTFQSLGWGALGFAGNAIFAALAFPSSVTWTTTDTWPYVLESSFAVCAIAGGISGFACLLFSYKFDQEVRQRGSWIAADMRKYAEKFRQLSSPSGLPAHLATPMDLARQPLESPAALLGEVEAARRMWGGKR